MSESAQLWLFFVLVSGVVMLPGLDMAFVLASSLTGGRRAGIAATAGIVAGGVCHVLMTALGLIAVLRLLPAVFNAMLLLGAGYIGWIGANLCRGNALLPAESIGTPRSQRATFRQGLVTSLLNPKAYLFMFAIFPQFLAPGPKNYWGQVTVLWLIIAGTQWVIYGGLAIAGGSVRTWLDDRPEVGRRLARFVGLLLVSTAIYTATKVR